MPRRWLVCAGRAASTSLARLLVCLVIVLAALGNGAPPARAQSTGREEATFSLAPEEGLSTRLLFRPGPDAVLVALVQADDALAATAGASFRMFSGGPVLLHGGLRALADPLGGGPGSRSWREPTGVSLDASLSPTTRFGFGMRVPVAGTAVWMHDGAIAHALVLGGELAERAPLRGSRVPANGLRFPARVVAEAVAMHAGRVAGADSVPDGWFGVDARPKFVSYLLGRFSVEAVLARVGVEGSLSVPAAELPGFWVRTHVGLSPVRGLSLDGRLVLVSPDSREGLSGTRTGATLEGALDAELSSGWVTLSAGTVHSAAGPVERYALVGVPWARLRLASDHYESRVRLSLPERVPLLRSLSIAAEAATLPDPVRDFDVEARLVAEIVDDERLAATIRVTPSVAIAEHGPLAAALAAELVCAGTALAHGARADGALRVGFTVEWVQGSDSLEATWRARYAVGRATAPE